MDDFDLRYAALRRTVIENAFAQLNDKQREAVLKTEGPLLLLAGAGSGKTTVLINRIINLLRFGCGSESTLAPDWAGDEELALLAREAAEPGCLPEGEVDRLCAVDPPKPWEILAITFTNKAAGELRTRLEVACGDAGRDVWAHTFHTACTRILRRYIPRLGYESGFTIYDEDDKKRLITAVIKDLGFDEKRFDPRGVMSAISRAKDQLLTPEDVAGQAGSDLYQKNVARIYHEYQKRCRAASALDFDDIICRTVELLQTQDDVREYYQHKFRYVLVDEYQDTNHAQYVLCSLLSGGWRNLCVVGDDDQSIYKFRGASIANILEFERQFPDAVTIRLEQNYRSTGSILDAANHVIACNQGRKGKTLWTEKEKGAPITVYQADTQEDEALFIASAILEGQAKGEHLRDYTILYRNNALSNFLQTCFVRQGIPFAVVRGRSFLDSQEIRDMRAYLEVIHNPADGIRLRRIVNNPPRKIGAKTLDTVEELAAGEGTSAFAVMTRAAEYPALSRASAALLRFADMIADLGEKARTLPLDEVYDALLEQSGYRLALEMQGSEEAQSRLDNIRELKSSILDYMKRTAELGGEPSLEGFLEELSLISDVDKYDENADVVTMMTMHSAKGLEFPHVFLCGVEEGLFPSYRSMDSQEEMEEERRLCYVAMTRAKETLTITCAQRRMLYGQTSYARPSRFIAEIPAELVREAGHKLRREERSPRPDRSWERAPVRPPRTAPAAYAPQSAPLPDFRPGMHIRHKAFGPGKIVEVTPMGGDMLLRIQFEEAGEKLMMAKTAMRFMK
ncbi:MAG: UvrD-helicase domain-containing protein [Clostridia bacterium]|nr:UvrD-helicase domain-containing protein [Clostridia bacterium]MDD7672956.1 3'-5' exonuclease [Clostridia bacterium]MDY2929994.1 3'-5' exonuclease [Clostridiaceae bacterium]